MFIDIYDNRGYWNLKDSEFIEETLYPIWHYSDVEVIILVYNNRHINPILPLKRYYEGFFPKNRIYHLNHDMETINRRLPIAFKNEYYCCIRRHINKLDWIGK